MELGSAQAFLVALLLCTSVLQGQGRGKLRRKHTSANVIDPLPSACGQLEATGPPHGCPWAFILQRTARAPLMRRNGPSEDSSDGGDPEKSKGERQDAAKDGGTASAVVDDTDVDQVTVFFYTQDPVKSIHFSLPERQDCAASQARSGKTSPDDGIEDDADVADTAAVTKGKDFPSRSKEAADEVAAVCDGYRFSARSGTNDMGCTLRRYSNNSHEVRSFNGSDLLATSLVKKCKVSNKAGEGEEAYVKQKTPCGDDCADVFEVIPKRSMVRLQLNQVESEGTGQSVVRGWQTFTIDVRNPTFTPTGKDVLLQDSNAFQLALMDVEGNRIGGSPPDHDMTFPARPIRQNWVCHYSDYVLTTQCTAKCGGGDRYSVRKLLNPPPQWVEQDLLVDCSQPLYKTQPCNTQPCKVDCELGDWIRWADGPCSVECGGGVEIQRRRVVKAPNSGGAYCVIWNDPARMRTRGCNTQACPTRVDECKMTSEGSVPQLDHCGPGCTFEQNPSRCEPQGARCLVDSIVGRAGNLEPKIVMQSCTRFCGTGIRNYMHLVKKKDSSRSVDKTCGGWFQEPCNTQPCQEFEFFPYYEGSLPLKGQWFVVSISFRNEVIANSLTIKLPPKFEVDMVAKDDGEHGACRFLQHNLPGIAKCDIVVDEREAKNHKYEMRIKFVNPLETLSCNGGENCTDRPAAWQLVTWVKHPEDCAHGVTSNGICVGSDRAWVLLGWGRDHDAPVWFSSAAGYEIFDDLEAGKRYVADHHRPEDAVEQAKLQGETLATGGRLGSSTSGATTPQETTVATSGEKSVDQNASKKHEVESETSHVKPPATTEHKPKHKHKKPNTVAGAEQPIVPKEIANGDKSSEEGVESPVVDDVETAEMHHVDDVEKQGVAQIKKKQDKAVLHAVDKVEEAAQQQAANDNEVGIVDGIQTNAIEATEDKAALHAVDKVEEAAQQQAANDNEVGIVDGIQTKAIKTTEENAQVAAVDAVETATEKRKEIDTEMGAVDGIQKKAVDDAAEHMKHEEESRELSHVDSLEKRAEVDAKDNREVSAAGKLEQTAIKHEEEDSEVSHVDGVQRSAVGDDAEVGLVDGVEQNSVKKTKDAEKPSRTPVVSDDASVKDEVGSVDKIESAAVRNEVDAGVARTDEVERANVSRGTTSVSTAELGHEVHPIETEKPVRTPTEKAAQESRRTPGSTLEKAKSNNQPSDQQKLDHLASTAKPFGAGLDDDTDLPAVDQLLREIESGLATEEPPGLATEEPPGRETTA